MTEYMCSETQEILHKVMNYAYEHDVTCITTGELGAYTPSAAYPKRRRILINLGFHDPYQIPYQAAHEVDHVIEQHSGVLYFRGEDLYGQEGEANRGALKILVPLYFSDIDMEVANPYRFMKALSIPNTMYDYVCETMTDYYA